MSSSIQSSHSSSIKMLLSIISIFLILSLIFIFYFRSVYPIEYENLAGSHSWLAASTIKFVNGWLKDGAVNLHFTNLENPPSIEFSTLESRIPYLSYPSGSTLFVWAAAKALGLNHIDISFVKHLAQRCMWVEVLLLAAFLYVFLTRTSDLKEIQKSAIITFLSALWFLLPANHYYLINSFFADQVIILYVFIFQLLDYLRSWDRLKSKKILLPICILESIVIYLGVLTDYYFWILIFFVFLFDLISNCIQKRSLKMILSRALYYIIPVVASVGTFIWQLHFFDNWVSSLLNVFLFRAGATGDIPIKAMLLYNFAHAFADASENQLIYLIIFTSFTILLGILYLRKKGSIKICFSNKNIAVVLTYSLSIFFQIFLLKNHSAVHQVSMIKAGWFEIMLFIIPALLITKLLSCENLELVTMIGKRTIPTFYLVLCLSAFMLLSILNFPMSTRVYYTSRYEYVDYSIPKVIYENTDYNDVCLSFTYQISTAPPNSLAISNKRVYQISSREDIQKLFPDLEQKARYILVIDKTAKIQNPITLKEQNDLAETGTLIYEDDEVCLFHII